jgi:hypothetical protein
VSCRRKAVPGSAYIKTALVARLELRLLGHVWPMPASRQCGVVGDGIENCGRERQYSTWYRVSRCPGPCLRSEMVAACSSWRDVQRADRGLLSPTNVCRERHLGFFSELAMLYEEGRSLYFENEKRSGN